MDTFLSAVADVFTRHINFLNVEGDRPKFDPGAWESITSSLSLLEFPIIVIKSGSLIEKYHSSEEAALVKLDEDHAEFMLENVTCISFEIVYPHVISELVKSGFVPDTLIFRIFSYITDNHKELKKNLSTEEYAVIRTWINYFFGKTKVHNLDTSLVTGTVSNILSDLLSAGEWVYVDTNEAWFVGNCDTAIELARSTGIPFDVEHFSRAIFFRKKFFVAFSDPLFKTRGFRKMKSNIC